MRDILRPFVALILLGACAGPSASSRAPAKTIIVCNYEPPTGSNIPKTVCYRQDEINDLRVATQEWLLRPRMTPHR